MFSFRSLNLPERLSKTKKIHSMDRFHGNGPYGKIPTKKEPIRTFGFTSRLSCHIIMEVIIHVRVYYTMNNINCSTEIYTPYSMV